MSREREHNFIGRLRGTLGVLCALLLVLALCVGILPAQASSARGYSLQITILSGLREGDTGDHPVSGEVLGIWRVGSWEQGALALEGSFAGAGAAVSAGSTSSEVLAAAKTLFSFARDQQLGREALAVATDASGTAGVSGLSAGVYLIAQTRRRAAGEGAVVSNPSLVVLPLNAQESLAVSPKSRWVLKDVTGYGDLPTTVVPKGHTDPGTDTSQTARTSTTASTGATSSTSSTASTTSTARTGTTASTASSGGTSGGGSGSSTPHPGSRGSGGSRSAGSENAGSGSARHTSGSAGESGGSASQPSSHTRTGDASEPLLWVCAVLVSACALMLLTAMRQRQER